MNEIEKLNNILSYLNIKANCISYNQNNNYFYYDLILLSKSKIKDIEKYKNEIALLIKAPNIPIIKILHQEGLIRLEFFFKRKNCLRLFDYFIDSPPEGELNILLGEDISGNRVWMDLSKNPHMIIAGTTGSGKSIAIHNIIANLLYYNNVHQFLIDPKQIEFIDYDNNNIRNIRVGYSYNDAISILDSLLSIMKHRYEMIRSGKDPKSIPYIILIIDEFADLILQDMNDLFYNKLCQLSQKCRASKISIILSTQRPSSNIISGTIKANFPVRISCKVASSIDSRIILDSVGAENLNGQGDALLKDHLRYLNRFQIAYTNPKEICNYFN